MNFVPDSDNGFNAPPTPLPLPPRDFIGAAWSAARPPDPPGTWPQEGQPNQGARQIEVSAAVTGAANINSAVTVSGETTIKVELSPDLVAKVSETSAQLRQIAAQTEQTKMPLRSENVAVNASGPGSTGKSMPDLNSHVPMGRFGRN
jgi:hypothetical protein